MNFFYYIINLCCNKFDHNEEKNLEIVTNLDCSGELESPDASSGKTTTMLFDDSLYSGELNSSYLFSNYSNDIKSSQKQSIKIDCNLEDLSQIEEVSEYSSNAGVNNINNSYYSLDQSLVYSPQAYVLAEKNLNLKANIKRFRH